MAHSGRYWHTVDDTGTQWKILAHSGEYWQIVNNIVHSDDAGTYVHITV